ncbi:Xylulose kinase [Streptomyces californicus]
MLGPAESAGMTPEGLLISAGTGETMAAAFGLGVSVGDAVVSLGASGSVMAVHHEALADPSGMITSFADATGMHLPVVHVSNAVRALRGTAEMLGLDGLEELSALALKSTPGASGLVLLPYLEGERTPQLPHTAGTLCGLRRESMKPEHLARASFEGMLCSLADALDVLRGRGVEVRRVFLLGAAAELPAVQALAPAVFGSQVVVPQPAQYAAIGAARQAAWALGVSQGSLDPRTPRPGRARRPRCWSPATSWRWAARCVSSTGRPASRSTPGPSGASTRSEARVRPECGRCEAGRAGLHRVRPGRGNRAGLRQVRPGRGNRTGLRRA